jgi:hypothetical protein
MSHVNGDEAIVVFGKQPWWNEYIHTYSTGTSDKINNAFHALAMSLIRPYSEWPGDRETIALMGKKYQGAVYGVMRRESAEAFVLLWESIQPALNAAYQAGKDAGSNLLMRLATGDLAPNEFLKSREKKE